MNWDDYSERCDEESKRLGEDAPDFHQLAHKLDLVPAMLLDLEHATESAVDAAVEHFAVHATWPPLSPMERTMVVFRLEFAASLACLLSMPEPGPVLIPEPSLDVPDEHVWRWLLIAAWRLHGFPQIHDTIARLLRGGADAKSSQ